MNREYTQNDPGVTPSTSRACVCGLMIEFDELMIRFVVPIVLDHLLEWDVISIVELKCTWLGGIGWTCT